MDWLCDRCGDVLLDHGTCRCATPYDPATVRRRHRDAVRLARVSVRRQAMRPQDGRSRPAA